MKYLIYTFIRRPKAPEPLQVMELPYTLTYEGDE
jgi:hypothetical protein